MKIDINRNGERKIFGPRFSATKGTYIPERTSLSNGFIKSIYSEVNVI